MPRPHHHLRLAAWLGAALLAHTAALTAQADAVSLTIVVTADGEPLSDARATAGAMERTTGPAGRVTLRLAAGPHAVAIARIGYRPARLELHLVADTAVAVALEPEAAELEELTATTTRTNRRVEDIPLRVEVVTQEEVVEKLLMTPGDISMLLNETGGLRVQTTSPSLGGASVRVQGLRGRYTLLLADGLPLYGGLAGGLGLLQVPPMDLGGVEVLKGTASALYGSSALAGVINLRSRRPGAERTLLLNATTLGGTDAVFFGGTRPSGGWAATLLAGLHTQPRTDRDGDRFTDVPGYTRVVLRPRLFHDGPGGRSWLATVGFTHEKRRGGTLEGAVAPDGLPFREGLRTIRLDAGTVLRRPLGGGLTLQARASGTLQHHRHRFGGVAEPDRHRTGFAEMAVSGEVPALVWLVGAAVDADWYRSEALPRFDYDALVPGVFASVEAGLSPRLALSASARLDHHNRHGAFLSPRLGLLYRLTDRWRTRLSGGLGFYGPTPWTEATDVTGLSRLQPLGALTAERARSASLDIEGTVGRLELAATAFGSVVLDAAGEQLTSDSAAPVALVNLEGQTRTWGGDLVLRYAAEPLRVTASYTYVHATEPRVTGGRRAVPLTPRHTAGLVTALEWEGQGRIGVETYLTGAQSLDDNPYRDRSPAYLLLGLLAEKRLGAVRVFVNLENLTGVRQTRTDPLVLPTRAPDGRWTVDAWGPLEGRVVNGGVRVAF